jgi:hypothetical protein
MALILVIIIFITIITQMLQLPGFCTLCVFLSFTRAHFVIDPWAVDLAGK